MSFQTRYFYAIIIGLPMVKPKHNIILCFELSSLWCKKTKSWMHTQKVMYLSLLNYGSNHLTLRDPRGRSFQIKNNSDKQTENRKILLLGVINHKKSI